MVQMLEGLQGAIICTPELQGNSLFFSITTELVVTPNSGTRGPGP